MSIELILAIASPIVVFVANFAVTRHQTVQNEKAIERLGASLAEAVLTLRREQNESVERAANAVRRDFEQFKANAEMEIRTSGERFHRYVDEATNRREVMMRELAALQVKVATTDGAYIAIIDRFDSMERSVESSMDKVASEVKALEGRVLRQEGRG